MKLKLLGEKASQASLIELTVVATSLGLKQPYPDNIPRKHTTAAWPTGDCKAHPYPGLAAASRLRLWRRQARVPSRAGW
jgi:hypothetical protein